MADDKKDFENFDKAMPSEAADAPTVIVTSLVASSGDPRPQRGQHVSGEEDQ